MIERDGENVEYLCVELSDTVGSLLMIPVSSIEENGLRPSTLTFDLIIDIMASNPEELDDHHRTRQGDIERRIKSGKSRAMVKALRDLCWRETRHRLTNADSRLRDRIQDKLVKELALRPSMTLRDAKARMTVIIQEAMRKHEEEKLPEPASIA